jgi:hypothetical protein
MSKPILGVSENKFTRGEENIFKICGAGLTRSGPDPRVDVTSRSHNWTNPAVLIGKNSKWLCVSSVPTRRTTGAPRKREDAYDDITVTVTFDEGLSTEFQIAITCDNVEYDDP